MLVPGTLVVAGDFNRAVTLNVSRARLTDYGLARTASLTDLGAALVADVRRQEGLFNFELLAAASRTGADGLEYSDMELRIETCKGSIIEGRGGRARCVTLDDVQVPTLPKHVFQTATMCGDYVYLAVGGTLESRWQGAAGELVPAAQSLMIVLP